MKKLINVIVLLCLFLTGCQQNTQVLMRYSGDDTNKPAIIGTYVTAVAGEFMTKELSVVEESNNTMTDPSITANTAFVINDTDQEVVFASNVYDRIYPASTTKLLTALMVLQYGELNDMVTVSKDNAGITVYGAKLCNFKAGDTMTLETLLNCLLVYSGNDASVAIGEHLFGSEEELVQRMNEEAIKIGATNTHFTNSHGLHDPNHYTSAYDMYLIFKACLEYDQFTSIIRQATYDAIITDSNNTVKTITYETTNMFLLGTKDTPEGVTVFGGKTGSTGDAGDCLILLSSGEDGTSYISAVFKALGKNSLYDQMAYLLQLK